MNKTCLMALAAALVVWAPSEASAKAAKMTGFDVLSQKGHTVTLKVKLEQTMLGGMANPDVEKETLDYFLQEKNGRKLAKPLYLGNGTTNSDGIATLDWKPKGAGQWLIKVRIRKGSEYSASPARIHVAVPPPTRTIVLVQIDGTVSTATNLKMFRGTDPDKIKAVEGSKALLKLLAQHHQLVYLTDLEISFTSKFKAWLELRGIPQAPTIFWELFERSLSHAKYMNKLIAKLREDHPMIQIGIGGQDADGKAFVKNGMAGIVINQEPGDDLPDTVVTAGDWKAAVRHVLQCRRTETLLKQLASGKDVAKSKAALLKLSLLGQAGVGYVHRYRADADPNLAATATLIAGKLRASRTFAKALDLSTADRARNSLLAAWRYGELSVVRTLYKSQDEAKQATIPAFVRCEEVARTEPEPRKVVFKVRLIDAKGNKTVRTVTFFQGDDKSWRVSE